MSEADKVTAHREEAQVIGRFLEWLRAEGFRICKYQEYRNNGQPRYLDRLTGKPTDGYCSFPIDNPEFSESDISGFYPVDRPERQWIADHFGIDLEKYGEEQDATLQRIRELNGCV